jgi:hypothetical protein
LNTILAARHPSPSGPPSSESRSVTLQFDDNALLAQLFGQPELALQRMQLAQLLDQHRQTDRGSAQGSAQVGLIIAYSKPSESDVSQFYRTMADPFIQRPIGLDEDSACGLQAQRYLHAHQLTSADLAEVTVAAWRKANSNPTLELKQVPTVSEVLASPMVASPLTQAMMARPVDGAVASARVWVLIGCAVGAL